MNNKIITMLGFAAKAGRLCYGMKASVEALARGKVVLAVCAEDVSKKSRKEIDYYCKRYSARLLMLTGIDMEAMSAAVGRRCGVLTVNDSVFADSVLKAYIEGGKANDE